MPVIMEVLIIADPVISLLVAEAEVVLLLPLIIKEPVVPLLIVGMNVVALLIGLAGCLCKLAFHSVECPLKWERHLGL